MRTREDGLQAIRENDEFDVLVIGGGVNGISAFRELALQGVRVLLAERDDFVTGSSAASSHMLHGGIRYLENGEFRLVREALHERNRMLKNAPHYSKPLPTTIPMFRWFSGMLNAPLKFVGLLDRPAERGAAVIKIGLTFYDIFARADKTMPNHEFNFKKKSLEMYPQLNPDVVCTATYYDAWMPNPERICIDLLRDAEEHSEQAYAVNYLRVDDLLDDGSRVGMTDMASGETYVVKPRVVVNAAGPWIDFVHEMMDLKTQFIGGTKGSHLVLDNQELLEACNGHEFFFENEDGRITLIFPYLNRVLVGTTDIRLENPEEAVCSDEEVDYILDMIDVVFPNIKVDRSHIVYTFSGVRPLPNSDADSAGTISRDHSIRTVGPDERVKFPIHSLIGGKWTTFRAFGEQTADLVLDELVMPRKLDTKTRAFGGGVNYPETELERSSYLRDLTYRTEIDADHILVLFERYGTLVEPIAEYIGAANDAPLDHVPGYTRREIEWLSQNEKVVHLEDVLKRRSLMAMLGYATEDAVREVASIMAQTLGWNDERLTQEIENTMRLFRSKHRYDIIEDEQSLERA